MEEGPGSGGGPFSPAEERVLRAFLKDGQLVTIPARASKRRVLLEFIVRAFEPGIHMPEREVDAVLRAFYAYDWVSLRRFLVDEGLLTREDGWYWRTGGWVDVPPLTEESTVTETTTTATTTGVTQEIVDVRSAEELRELLGSPMPRSVKKERARLHAHDRAWIAHSPFCLIATAAADGSCDVSPKGDPPGFVLVLDETTVAIPDRPGNRRVDGFLNVLSNPHVGLIFFVPGREQTLRINGRAKLVRQALFFDQMIVRGHRPSVALLVEVEQVFFHCAKAFKRAGLWQPGTWPDPEALPSMARIVKDTIDTPESLAELEAYYGPQYDQSLYG